MATLPRRHRSSTSASTPPSDPKAVEVLRRILGQLDASLEDRLPNGYPDTQALSNNLRSISQYLSASHSPNPTQDHFRHLHGFPLLLTVLRTFSGFYNPLKRTDEEKKGLFSVLQATLDCLSSALREHPGSRRYFRDRVDGGGWGALEQAIASIGLGGSDDDLWSSCQLFGSLLSFALGNPEVINICQVISQQCLLQNTAVQEHGDPDESLVVIAKALSPPLTDIPSEVWANISSRTRKLAVPSTRIVNPEILPAVISFWTSLPRHIHDGVAQPHPCSLIVLRLLINSVTVSLYNLSAVHSTGVYSALLRAAFRQDLTLSPREKEPLQNLCKMLAYLGIQRPADTQFLLAAGTQETSDFCLEMASQFSGPPLIHFDLSLYGYSAVELPTLGRVFPPQSGTGYTLTAWIRVDRFDPSAHTTIFGAFDTAQACFLLVYLERDTHNFILQTSVTSARPSVRFKSTVFEEKKWYHIALVHRRPRTMSASKAFLYVNGEFVEHLKCPYPSPPAPSNGSTESFASFASASTNVNPVQAFLGTPKGLSSHSGPGVVFSKWSLASAHLFEDVLSDDFLAVHFHLGPRYQGNFQDSLGGFQTYEASAALGLRNELLHPGKNENSDILKAIRDKAGYLIPESKVLLSILPASVLRDDGRLEGSVLLRSLPRAAANSLSHLLRRNGAILAPNSAVPSLPDALLRSCGVAGCYGDPVVAIPSYFDDHFWRLAGFTPLALRLVHQASTVEETVHAVELITVCIKNSWRNSEAMERDNGYAILAMLLRNKLGSNTSPPAEGAAPRLQITNDERDQLSFRLLSLLLGFVGYRHEDPIESFIINPLAYRILLIDFDTWRKSCVRTQELLYRQFVTFAVQSKYHQFNSRRLVRMRIVKRLLDALKGEVVSEEIMPYFIPAFEKLVQCNFNAEAHRNIALFLTYSFHTPSASVPRTPKPSSVVSRSGVSGLIRRPTGDDPNPSARIGPATSRGLSKKQVGIKILEMYSKLLCSKDSTSNIQKFARTVTNKWLLNSIESDDPEIVVYGCKILARLIVSHGTNYTSKFTNKTGGFAIMAHYLRRWWDLPTLWPILFSILFGSDVAEIDFGRNFEFFSLVDLFGDCKIVYPDVLPVLMAMLQHGVKDVVKSQSHPASPSSESKFDSGPSPSYKPSPSERRARARSMDLSQAMESLSFPENDAQRVAFRMKVLQTITRTFADLHARSPAFRDFAATSEYVRYLLLALYPVIVSTDVVNAKTELDSQGSALTFGGSDVIIQPIGGSAPGPIVRTGSVTNFSGMAPTPRRGTPLRKAASFILVTDKPSKGPGTTRLTPIMSPKLQPPTEQTSSAMLEGLLELVISVFLDQILARKDFSGFSLYLKIPPGFQEHQAYFESYVLRNTVAHLTNAIQFNQSMVTETKILQNLARFNIHITDAIFEGWFIGGEDSMMELTGMLLEFLQRDDIASLKTVRLCSQAVATIRNCFLRIILLRLSSMDDSEVEDAEANESMSRILYWQTALLGCLNADDDHMKLIWYQLYTKLIDHRESIRLAAATIMRILMVQKPDEAAALFRQSMTADHYNLAFKFSKLTEVDNESFVQWVDEHRPSLDVLFFGGTLRSWEEFVAAETLKSSELLKIRQSKRKDRLKFWSSDALRCENILLRHSMANGAWIKSIYNTEHIKYQRLMQDQQDDLAFLSSAFVKMTRELSRPGAVFSEQGAVRWKLDLTEGRNRMRLRLLPDYSGKYENYQPKRKTADGVSSSTSKVTNAPPLVAKTTQDQQPIKVSHTNSHSAAASASDDDKRPGTPFSGEQGSLADADDSSNFNPDDDEYELVDDPNDPSERDEAFEDRNRKVMRRLESGDQVQAVFNISRIVGLETCDGILIIGKEALYIMDNVFQCKSGEIVNAWQAPPDERDPFSQIIMGASSTPDIKAPVGRTEQESRSWRWKDVIVISKRRFLFRDVAIEFFFTDGRSYLLTTINHARRDELFSQLFSKAPHIGNPMALPNPEDAWRLDALRVIDESPQGFGSKFSGLFGSSPLSSFHRKWQRGEMSNFHYLMVVNTMAGRTFNDLTQYPVFPWVLADYTSEELNLSDPATFRDLSKPMGSQTQNRIPGFRDKYKTLLEIDDKPYHYGTHYSTAMIVASYLIRLPPFVQSYILLQGGSFDHADRLFSSIPGAWKSASSGSETDIRELIPEFFCLPEFLTNVNGYNFGFRESTGQKVDNVVLPPWANGDPKIFIQKHREALESPHVSQNLHHWIDLVFGYKQLGEAAVDNLNVFHHLSYHGATDLDEINDPQERAITVATIHNFGQTPHQVFSKPHPPRECPQSLVKRLDTSIYLLTRQPHPLFESHEKVSSLIYAQKLDRLLCAPPLRLNFPPYDKYMEWGYTDNSIRFFFSENRKPAGLYETLHIGQISCALFPDSKTLITAGEDCVISVYGIQTAPGKAIELLPRSSLFSHTSPVTTLAVSKSFNTILSASDGQVFLWDLNKLEFIRGLPFYQPVECAQINDLSGEILLCSGPRVILYTINGSLLLNQNVCEDEDDYVRSCAFYEGSGVEWLESFLIFTGHKNGRINVWKRTAKHGVWMLELVRRLESNTSKPDSNNEEAAAITCITPRPTCLYSGDEDGKVYEWNLIHQRER